ncbi:hypothetical protein NVP1170O_193 [Vibrio phage 1.170.O._10N.261.52.C3]|nr:hypothetical protein NVP1170O_193 [Vibrio phage 1.170.O._10N.261.52.C3]
MNLSDLTGEQLHELYFRVRQYTTRGEYKGTTYSRDSVVFKKISKMTSQDLIDFKEKLDAKNY